MNLAEMIFKTDSTKNVQAVVFLEKLGTIKWGQFVLHINIENLKFLLAKDQLSDFEMIWQQSFWSRQTSA